MLPMHPQPQPREILSSWMVRQAFANGFMLHTFYDKLLGYHVQSGTTIPIVIHPSRF
ncbi:TniQ family protein [Chromobacterium haemolyticum]|uniref:TniQ family protein n=1 Tax=Chromobacterium haemolyticum TaxID=394935 RepID=UPI0012DFA20B|nr:TniQ family protein [Chromobacterium haemolyticum]